MPRWLLGVGPLVLVAVAVAAFALLDGPGLGERRGPPVEELAIERTVLRPGRHRAHRAQRRARRGDDRAGAGQRRVRAVHRRGGRRSAAPGHRDRAPAAAVGRGRGLRGGAADVGGRDDRARDPGRGRDAGHRRCRSSGSWRCSAIYVGVIPIALGMLWLPWIRRIPRGVAARRDGAHGRPARVPGHRRDARGPRARGARARRRSAAPALVFVGAVVSYLLLSGRVVSWLEDRQAQASGGSLAMLIAIGIGLHNLGEGVAIGSAYTTGALALGAFLVIGFALHNTTEGLAIVAPIAHERPPLGRLALLGLVAGAPAVLGAWIGAAAFNSSDRGVPVRLRRRGDRPGHRPARARRCATRRAGCCTRPRSAGCSPASPSCSRPDSWYPCEPWPQQPTLRRDRELREGDLRHRAAHRWPGVDERPRRAPVGDRRVRVSAMSKKLADRGLVEHVPYRGVAADRRRGEGRARGAAPPPAPGALPRRAPRRAVGPRPRRGRGARARHLRGPRGADRGEARPPDPRPARRPDPRRRSAHRRGDDPQPGRARAGRPRRVRPGVGHRSREAPLPRRARRLPGRHASRSSSASPSAGRSPCASAGAATSSGGGLADAMRVVVEP